MTNQSCRWNGRGELELGLGHRTPWSGMWADPRHPALAPLSVPNHLESLPSQKDFVGASMNRACAVLWGQACDPVTEQDGIPAQGTLQPGGAEAFGTQPQKSTGVPEGSPTPGEVARLMRCRAGALGSRVRRGGLG